MENIFNNNIYSGQSFVGFVQSNKIFNSYGQQIGVSLEEYNKAIETAKGFEKILYDKGILVKPKTAEEMNKELQDTLKQMQGMIVTLTEKVNTLEAKDVKQANDNVNADKGSTQR